VAQIRETATARIMREINRAAVLDFIRRHSPVARSEIAERLHVSLPTAMRVVEDLLSEDLVRYCGSSPSTGGRPRSLIEYNGSAHAVIGIDLGGSHTFGTVADLFGNVQCELDVSRQNGDAQANLQSLFEVIEQLLDAPRPAGQRVRGIGIGVPGFTRTPEGIVTWVPSLGWRDLPLKDILHERFNLPVFVENDVNLAALGEWGFGAGREVRDLVCINIGTGIGAGVIIDGALHRGYRQSAGEIGYILPGLNYLNCPVTKYGALESQASGLGIARRGMQALADLGRPAASDLSAEDVFGAARDGESWATAVVAETIDYLAIAIANVTAIFDPEVIILGGGVAGSADLLIDPICKRVRGCTPFDPALVASPLGQRAAVMGAIMLVLTGTTESLVLRRLR
jgi:glucokinase-like ROK family protein